MELPDVLPSCRDPDNPTSELPSDATVEVGDQPSLGANALGALGQPSPFAPPLKKTQAAKIKRKRETNQRYREHLKVVRDKFKNFRKGVSNGEWWRRFEDESRIRGEIETVRRQAFDHEQDVLQEEFDGAIVKFTNEDFAAKARAQHERGVLKRAEAEDQRRRAWDEAETTAEADARGKYHPERVLGMPKGGHITPRRVVVKPYADMSDEEKFRYQQDWSIFLSIVKEDVNKIAQSKRGREDANAGIDSRYARKALRKRPKDRAYVAHTRKLVKLYRNGDETLTQSEINRVYGYLETRQEYNGFRRGARFKWKGGAKLSASEKKYMDEYVAYAEFLRQMRKKNREGEELTERERKMLDAQFCKQ